MIVISYKSYNLSILDVEVTIEVKYLCFSDLALTHLELLSEEVSVALEGSEHGKKGLNDLNKGVVGQAANLFVEQQRLDARRGVARQRVGHLERASGGELNPEKMKQIDIQVKKDVRT